MISIIIPVLNRARLIPETLTSIQAQTHTNWECLVVDDGSTDGTQKKVKAIAEADPRIKLLQRPNHHLPGGNGARNFGLEQARGDYIQFFDSDDLMHEDKLSLKLKTLVDYNLDFVIGRTAYFSNSTQKGYDYSYQSEDISFRNYACGPVNWFTPDPLYKKQWIGAFRFNEELKAGQEYNFNCKLLAGRFAKAVLLPEVLTHRRDHDTSIAARRKSNRTISLELKFWSHWHTLLDCRVLVKDVRFEKYSLKQCMWVYFELKNKPKLPVGFMALLREVFGWSYLWFILAQYANRITGRYFYFYKKLK